MNFDVLMAVVYLSHGNVIMKMTAKMAPMRKIASTHPVLIMNSLVLIIAVSL